MYELPTQLFPRPLGRIVGDYPERMQWHYEPTPLLLPAPPPPLEATPSAQAARRSRVALLAWAWVALFVVYVLVTR